MKRKIKVISFIAIYTALAMSIAVMLYSIHEILALSAVFLLVIFRIAAPRIFVFFFYPERKYNNPYTQIAVLAKVMEAEMTLETKIAVLCNLRQDGFFKGNEALFYDYMALIHNDSKEYLKALAYSKRANIMELIEKGYEMKLGYFRILNQSRYMLELNEYEAAEALLDSIQPYSVFDDSVISSVNLCYARLNIAKRQPETARVYIHRAKSNAADDSMLRSFLSFLEAVCDILEGEEELGQSKLKEIISNCQYKYVVDKAETMYNKFILNSNEKNQAT